MNEQSTPTTYRPHDWVKDFRGLGAIIAGLGALWGIAMLIESDPVGAIVIVVAIIAAIPFFAVAQALKDRRARLTVAPQS